MRKYVTKNITLWISILIAFSACTTPTSKMDSGTKSHREYSLMYYFTPPEGLQTHPLGVTIGDKSYPSFYFAKNAARDEIDMPFKGKDCPMNLNQTDDEFTQKTKSAQMARCRQLNAEAPSVGAIAIMEQTNFGWTSKCFVGNAKLMSEYNFSEEQICS